MTHSIRRVVHRCEPCELFRPVENDIQLGQLGVSAGHHDEMLSVIGDVVRFTVAPFEEYFRLPRAERWL